MILTPLFIFKYGYNGVAAASFLVSVTSVAVFVIARKYVEFSFLAPVIRQFIASLIMFIFIVVTSGIINNFTTLLINAILAGLVYIGILLLIAREELVKTLKFIIISVRSKN